MGFHDAPNGAEQADERAARDASRSSPRGVKQNVGHDIPLKQAVPSLTMPSLA